jgi:hypothetical protein
MRPSMHLFEKHIILLAALIALAGPLFGDPIFATNTFDSGTEGWQPWTTSTVNGLTPGNPYLRIGADGSGVYGKMITFNPTAAWTGNYGAEGVIGIRMDIANMSDSDDVYLRIAIGNRASPQQSGGTWWISRTATFVPLGSAWTTVFLPFSESDMVVVGNIMGESDNESFIDTFADIRNIRILSAAIPIGATGDEFVGDVGIDNVALVPEPTTLPMIGTGVVILMLHRKRKADTLPDPKSFRTRSTHFD